MHAGGHLHLHTHNQSFDYDLSTALSASAGRDQIVQNGLSAAGIAFDTAVFLRQASAKVLLHLTADDCLAHLIRNAGYK